MVSPDRQRHPKLVTTNEAAAAVGVRPRTLRRYVNEGIFRPSVILPSGQARWSEEDIERLRGRSA